MNIYGLSKRSAAWLAASALFGCAEGAVSKGASSPSAETHELVGNPAPAFESTAKNAGRKSVAMSALRGKVVIVDFWGTFCEPCKKSFPKLQSLYLKYKASGLEVVGVSEDESEDIGKIAPFADLYEVKFPVVWDEKKAIAQTWKPPKMPTSFVVDRKGIVRYVHAGYQDGDDARIEDHVRELLDVK